MASELSLDGFVDIRAVYPVILTAYRTVRDGTRQRIEVDCSKVLDFSSFALAELLKTARDIEARGTRFLLAGCSDDVRARMVHPLLEALAR